MDARELKEKGKYEVLKTSKNRPEVPILFIDKDWQVERENCGDVDLISKGRGMGQIESWLQGICTTNEELSQPPIFDFQLMQLKFELLDSFVLFS